MAEMPPVPLTLEGAYVLHQMFRVRRSAWRALDESTRDRIAEEAVLVLSAMEQQHSAGGHPNQSAVYSQIGHKSDLLVIHFRDTLEQVHCAELTLARLELSGYIEPVHSYLSVVELGLYESTVKTYGQLREQGI